MKLLLVALLCAISYAQTDSCTEDIQRQRFRAEEDSSCVPQTQTRTCNNGQFGDWSGDWSAKKCRTRTRRTKDTDCKKTCGNGWSRYGTFGHGCCSSVFSCGGERERCEKYEYGEWQYVIDQCYNPTTSHGGQDTRVQYRQSAVNAPNSCSSEEQTRTCSDGIWDSWSGSYQHSNCEVRDQCYSPETSHGGTTTRTRYRESVVTRPNACTSQLQTKTCSDGNWGSWSGTYTYLTCVAQDAPTALPTPSPTGVRLCEVPEHYSTECDAILHGSVCEIIFICDPGMFADGVAQECTESGWVGPELDPNCRPLTCVLPSQQPDGVQYGESPALTHCSSAECDDYILNDVQCGPDHEMSLTKCTVDRDLVTIECISCVEDDQGICIPRSEIPTLPIFENFYYGIHIEDPFGSTYGYNIFEVAVEIPKAGVDRWQRDLIETVELDKPYQFLVEDQFSRTATGARGIVKSTTKKFAHYGEYVEHNSRELEIGVQLDNDLMAKAKENSAKGSTSKSKPMKYGSVGFAGSHSHNRKEGENYSHFVQFRASQFNRKQVFGTWRFNPNHDNVIINPNLVRTLRTLQPYSTSTEFQYENLFELYGTHYASTFDLGYEINAAEFSSECDSSEENTLSTTRENCFEASFQYKFTNLGGDGCITKTSDISTDEEEFMSFETATFEVRGGKDAENSALLDRLAEMKFDGSTKRTAEYDAWIQSTYRNPGIVGFQAHPIWNLIWTHPSLMDLFDTDYKTRLVNDMEKAFYAILQKKEDVYRADWCNAECSCGVEVDPVSCSCKECFKTFVSEDCCVQSSIDLFTCKENKADMAQFGFALFFALISLVF